jgi:bacteriorhodopsin
MFLYIIYTLVFSSRRAAIARNAKVGRMFTAISLYTILVWSMYPIVWVLGVGTQRISVNSEIIWFAVVCALFYKVNLSSISCPRAFLGDGC